MHSNKVFATVAVRSVPNFFAPQEFITKQIAKIFSYWSIDLKNCLNLRNGVESNRSVHVCPGRLRPSRVLSQPLILISLLYVAGIELNAKELPTDEPSVEELTELSLKELMDIVVISPAKRPEPLTKVSSAIYAITDEEIRRSGATSIPELLRMVPGLQVARIDANKWAISARGFNGRFANKLLVLIDGRSVYTPTFSGVRWNAQDLLLEDIKRIEVIRGPGATLWGANAVNGVINIITKEAEHARGGSIIGGGGTEEHGFLGLRYGGRLADRGHYRIYAKYFDRDDFVDVNNHNATDRWDKLQGGVRMDWFLSDRDTLTIQGDIFDDQTEQTFTFPSLTSFPSESFDESTDSVGGNLITQWDHTFSDSAEMSLQIYYDHYDRSDALFEELTETINIDFQNRFTIGKRQEVVWGLGYRFISDDFSDAFVLSFEPNARDTHFYSGFLQDNITLIDERLHIVVGSKIEHNYYTGFEVQPNIRFLATPSETQTFWGAIARAVRTPSRVENDGRINDQFIPPGAPGNPNPLPALIALFGNRDFESEELLAYELGYRIRRAEQWSLDIATFYNVYDELRTLEPNTANAFLEPATNPSHSVIPALVDSKLEGETYGAELVGNYLVNDWWRITAAYSYLRLQLHRDSDSRDVLAEMAEGESPQQQVSLRSSMDFAHDLELDLWLRFVDRLPGASIKEYLTLDIRIGWKPSENLELSVVGQNLLDSHHSEFMSRFINTQPTETQRSVYGKIVWHF